MTRVVAAAALSAAATVLLAGVGAQTRYPVSRVETISRTLRFSDGVERVVEVSAMRGSIRIAGHDDDGVDVVVRRTVRAETAEDADAGEAVRLEIGEADGAIRIHAEVEAKPGCDWETITRRRSRPRYEVLFDFDLRVPRDARLRLCTVNGGDVLVVGTSGDFEIDNVNGAIALAGVSGAGRAVTVNGAVSVAFAANPRSPSTFKSVNGDIDVIFQRNLSADLFMKTFNGGLFTDFDVTPLPAAIPVAERRRDGMTVYRGNRFTDYRVGQGGPAMTLDAFNGDIRIVTD